MRHETCNDKTRYRETQVKCNEVNDCPLVDTEVSIFAKNIDNIWCQLILWFSSIGIKEERRRDISRCNLVISLILLFSYLYKNENVMANYENDWKQFLSFYTLMIWCLFYSKKILKKWTIIVGWFPTLFSSSVFNLNISCLFDRSPLYPVMYWKSFIQPIHFKSKISLAFKTFLLTA